MYELPILKFARMDLLRFLSYDYRKMKINPQNILTLGIV